MLIILVKSLSSWCENEYKSQCCILAIFLDGRHLSLGETHGSSGEIENDDDDNDDDGDDDDDDDDTWVTRK